MIKKNPNMYYVLIIPTNYYVLKIRNIKRQQKNLVSPAARYHADRSQYGGDKFSIPTSVSLQKTRICSGPRAPR